MMTEKLDLETVLRQRQQLLKTARSYRTAKILFTCLELGVFEAVAMGAHTANEIAGAIKADLRGTELLLNAAVPLGWLEKKENRFFNTEVSQTFLVPGGPGYLSETLRLEGAFYRRWEHLTKAVKTGRRPEENIQDEQPSDWVRRFEYALYNMARPFAPFVAEALGLPNDRDLRLLDVGGGHGGYSIAIAQRYPRLQATVFELPRVVPVAREIIAQAGMSERVFVQEGDFQRDDLGTGYDVVLFLGVLNGEPPEGRPALIKKAFAALKPGGRLFLRDFVLEADRAGPPEATVFALQMLLATEAGGLNTREEWMDWFSTAGFTPMETIQFPEWVGTTLFVAEKPSIEKDESKRSRRRKESIK
jgi:SAM-dependent methyltransferase